MQPTATHLRQLKQRIRRLEAGGGGRSLDLRRNFNAQLRAARAIRGGGGCDWVYRLCNCAEAKREVAPAEAAAPEAKPTDEKIMDLLKELDVTGTTNNDLVKQVKQVNFFHLVNLPGGSSASKEQLKEAGFNQHIIAPYYSTLKVDVPLKRAIMGSYELGNIIEHLDAQLVKVKKRLKFQDLKPLRFTAAQLKKAGFTAKELKTARFTEKELKAAEREAAEKAKREAEEKAEREAEEKAKRKAEEEAKRKELTQYEQERNENAEKERKDEANAKGNKDFSLAVPNPSNALFNWKKLGEDAK